MIYICFIWYTFRVKRGVLEWYTFVFIWYIFGVRRRVLEWYTYVLFGIHSGSKREYLNDIRMYCLVYIRGQKGVLKWYTVGNKIGWYQCIIMYNEQYYCMISVSLRVYWYVMTRNRYYYIVIVCIPLGVVIETRVGGMSYAHIKNLITNYKYHCIFTCTSHDIWHWNIRKYKR